MISLQTNVNSLVAQNNLRVTGNFQSQTIQKLTSGYRINQSGDDAAGLAVANSFRSSINELTQGVRNANDGLSQLQIVDGGLNNISMMLDRMKTLATQSASGTFTGDRGTLNTEYQQIISEISRQAANINLNLGGIFNQAMTVYTGGANDSAHAQISVDLSGASSAVDAASLKLNTTSVNGGGIDLGAVTSKDTLQATQAITLYFNDNTTKSVTVAANQTISDAVAQLNGTAELQAHGVSFSVDGSNHLRVSSSQAFSIDVAAGDAVGGTKLLTNAAAIDTQNTGKFNTVQGGDFTALAGTTPTETVTFTSGAGSAQVALSAGADIDATIAAFNSNQSLQNLGITAVKVKTATGFSIGFQSDNFFSTKVAETGTVTADSGFNGAGALSSVVAADTTASVVGNAQAAITAINNAVKSLGVIQGKVGAGENKLQYAISLAQSQMSNFAAAQSQIRDADVAAEAANLTKAQVLQQASIAAMAQANSAPQQVLKLLQ